VSTDGEDDDFDRRPTPDEFPVARPSRIEIVRHKRTVPRGVPVVMSDTDRALGGRRERSAPVEYVSDGDTSPRAMFDFERPEYSRAVAELAAQLRRLGIDSIDGLAALAVKLDETKQRERTGRKDLEKQLEAFLRVQPGGEKFDELAAAVARLENQMIELEPYRSLTRKIGWGLLGTVIVMVVGVCAWFYARGGKEMAVDMQLEQRRSDEAEFKRQLEIANGRINALERNYHP
jgi:hypothetical protein